MLAPEVDERERADEKVVSRDCCMARRNDFGSTAHSLVEFRFGRKARQLSDNGEKNEPQGKMRHKSAQDRSEG